MQLFYNPDINENTSKFTFPKDESKHIAKVLRKKTGDTLYITNGKGWLFDAQMEVADLKNCMVTTKKIMNPIKSWGRCQVFSISGPLKS